MPKTYATLVELFELSTREFAANDYLGSKKDGHWSWLSYREVQTLVDQARGGLTALGVGPGDRVALVSDNRVEWVVIAFATLTLGASIVPMYEEQLAEEWAFILADCGAKVVVASRAAIYEKLLEEQKAIPTLQHVLGMELPASDASSYAGLLARGKAAPAPARSVEPTDIAGYIYTSGTTGNPKGVKL
ncbi:MAG TPA: AMP-binding protein, partial [Polyangiaceae bacterium]|nr:AMP-binding protein [Polyangiaceae bacterium]